MGLALIPLFFMVVYVAKFFDMKQAAHQASRFAAFERSWDPNARYKTDQDIEDELQVRFFSTKREINFKDKAADLAADKHIPLWTDLAKSRLFNEFTDARLTWDKSQPMATGLNSAALSAAGGLLDLDEPNVIKAMVTVNVADVSHFDALQGLNLTLPAATAIGAGSWSASGAQAGPQPACDTIRELMPLSADFAGFGGPVRSFITRFMGWFEDSELELGIVKPDLVPEGSVIRNGDMTNRQNVRVNQQDGNKCPRS